MDTLEAILTVVLVGVCLALIAIVLVQQGKGAGIGAAFGSGASNTVFGSAGSATFMTRATTWLAVVFFAVTLALAWFAKDRAASLDDLGIPALESPAAEIPAPDSGVQEVPADDVPVGGGTAGTPEGGPAPPPVD